MELVDLFKIVEAEWAAVKAQSEVFLATLAIGLSIGWTAAWLILKQRLTHHKELLDHYKEVVAKKVPAIPVPKANSIFSIRKMLTGIALLLLIIIGPIYVILLSNKSASSNGNARLEFSGVRIEKIPGGTDNKLFVNLINHGTLAAIGPRDSYTHIVSDTLILEDELDRNMEKILTSGEHLAPQTATFQVQPGETVFDPTFQTITDEELQKIRTNKSYLYILSVDLYTDQALQSGYFVTEICTRSQGDLQSWIKCQKHNQIYKHN